MNKIALAAVAVAAFSLSACGKSDSADELADPDNVEMPAEEAMGTVDAAATPVADAAATASAEADASAVASDAAAAMSEAAAAPAAKQ